MSVLNIRKINVDLNLYNLFNNKILIGLADTTAGTPTLPLYWTNPGYGVFVTIAAVL